MFPWLIEEAAVYSILEFMPMLARDFASRFRNPPKKYGSLNGAR